MSFFSAIHQFQDNKQLLSQVNGAMNSAIGLNKEAVSSALKGISLSTLSKTERTAFLTTLKEVAGDGYLSKQDAGMLENMLKSFSQNAKGYNDKAFSKEVASTSAHQFDCAMDHQLNRTGGYNTELVEYALNTVDSRTLSTNERSSLLTSLKSFTGDGHINGNEAKTLIGMIKEFDDRGTCGLKHFWPFPNKDFNQCDCHPVGYVSRAIVAGGCNPPKGEQWHPQHADRMFSSRIDNMLGGCSESMARSALSGAFSRADLSKLGPQERHELSMMVSVATSDGKVNMPEARAIYDALQRAQKPAPGCPKLPMPCPLPPNNWSVEQKGGKADIDLGNYVVSLDENCSEMWLLNKATGEKSRVWGDPHFDTNGDGKDDVDFTGTITMNLDDGTKITINTTPSAGNKDITYSNRLTITNGHDSIVVSGLDELNKGDLKIEKGQCGALLDIYTPDGLDLYENNRGAGWLVQDGFSLRSVTQSDMDKTKTK